MHESHVCVHTFRVIWLRISNPRSLGSWCIKVTGESTLVTDSLVPLMFFNPDRSWITDPDPDHPKGVHRTKKNSNNRERLWSSATQQFTLCIYYIQLYEDTIDHHSYVTNWSLWNRCSSLLTELEPNCEDEREYMKDHILELRRKIWGFVTPVNLLYPVMMMKVMVMMMKDDFAKFKVIIV